LSSFHQLAFIENLGFRRRFDKVASPKKSNVNLALIILSLSSIDMVKCSVDLAGLLLEDLRSHRCKRQVSWLVFGGLKTCARH
jgi:hypothetical protein